MKSKRLRQYLQQKADATTKPIDKKEEVAKHPDAKIDQDFPGFPHGQAKKELIKPETDAEHETAATDTTDGDKMMGKDEQESDGSANAFEGK